MTKRLNEIFSELECCPVTADVGCDHGFLSLDILKNGVSKQVVATDISQKCLDKTINLLKSHNLEEKAECLCVDGLPLREFDQVLIAGMGGTEIIKILSNYFENLQIFPILVLQPMRDEQILRRFLNRSGYKIVADRIFKDKKFYRIIKAVKGEQCLTDRQILFGAVESEYKTSDFLEWIDEKIIKLEKIILNLQENNRNYEKQTLMLQECMKLKGN